MSLQPLIERRDYAKSGKDQLERNFVDLPDNLKDDVQNQFNDRIRGSAMDQSNVRAIEKLANAIIASEKEAVSPPGWSGTTKAMKKHKNITNPWALSWWLAKQKPGAKWGPGGKGKLTKKPKPHYKPEKKKKKKSSVDFERIAQIVDDDVIVTDAMQPATVSESSKNYSTVDTIKLDDGYVTIKTNYTEKNGEPVLEEYFVDKNGQVTKFNDVESFAAFMGNEGLL